MFLGIIKDLLLVKNRSIQNLLIERDFPLVITTIANQIINQ